MLGEDMDDRMSGKSTGIQITVGGIAVDEFIIESETGEMECDDKLIMWAVGHAVFGLRLPKDLNMIGTMIYNKDCGFRGKETKRVRTVSQKFNLN